MKQVDKERFIVKIGWSDKVNDRNNSLRAEFGDHYFVFIVRHQSSSAEGLLLEMGCRRMKSHGVSKNRSMTPG